MTGPLNFYDPELQLQLLQNPTLLHERTYTAITERSNGEYVITNPNNPLSYLFEVGISLVSDLATACAREFESLYPVRSKNSLDVYRHMSDFDYLHLTHQPATTSVNLLLEKDYLIETAVPFTSEYKKVIIPASALFRIGNREFHIYYPIEIRINSRTDNITVAYDTNFRNPLSTLKSNAVSYRLISLNQIECLLIQIPVYQFSRSVYTDAPTNTTGFNKTISYTQNFYAVRVLNTLNNVVTDIPFSLSDDIYDALSPVVKLTIIPEEKNIRLAIPQIYFDRGLIGTLKIEVLTTEGALDVGITEEEALSVGVKFFNSESDMTSYSTMLSKPEVLIIQAGDTKIIGGRNSIGFTEIRDRVVKNTLFDKLPITEEELKNHLADAGFSIIKYLDNITDRIYYAGRKMLDSNGKTVPVTVANVLFDKDKIGQVSSILSFADNSITVQPTTIYSYSIDSGQCIPLTDMDVTRLAGMSRQQLVDELNTVIYTRTPFHMCIYTDDKYPITKSFNLNIPIIETFTMERENAYSIISATAVSGVVIHRDNNTGGFVIRLGINKNPDALAIAENNFNVILSTRDKSGRVVYIKAHKVGQNSANLPYYDAIISTSYQISQDRYMTCYMYEDENNIIPCEIPLDAEFSIHILLNPVVAPPTPNDLYVLQDLPSDFSGYFGITRQRINVIFGYDLSSAIYNITTPVYSEQEYVRWPDTIYQTYTQDVYKTKTIPTPEGGTIEVLDAVVSNGQFQMTKLHSVGDLVLDADGNKRVLHYKNDIKFGPDGLPIVLKNRHLLYYVEAIMFDARLYQSEDIADTNYILNLSSELSSYIATVTLKARDLLEQTKMYLRPVRTIGLTQYGIGNGLLATLPLALGFIIRYFVSSSVMAQENLKALITATTIEVIEAHMKEPIISLTKVATELRNILGENITSIDVLGINGSPSLQTLIINEKNVEPMVALKLKINQDGTMSLVKDVAVEFTLDT